jgi:hypothetical protein
LRSKKTKDIVEKLGRMAARLDAETDDGKYRREAGQQVTELDAWGNPIAIHYSDEAIGERVEVRSAGRDGKLFSKDDLIERRMAPNGRLIRDGIATGTKMAVENLGETAANKTKENAKRLLEEAKRKLQSGDSPEFKKSPEESNGDLRKR